MGEVTDLLTGGERQSDRSPALEGSGGPSPSAATVVSRNPRAFFRRVARPRPERQDNPAAEPSSHGHRNGTHVLLPIAIFGGIAAVLAADLLSDYHAGHGPLHFILEMGAGVLALVGVAYFVRHAWEMQGVADDLERDLRASQADANRWRAEAYQALEGLGSAIDREFAKWSLTDAERSVALMLLKGMSHREIATQRGTNEGTVRQQALAIYRKAGLGGRSSLAAFFLEGLVLPARGLSSVR
jgi:DNA-binding CsgD family transcriptional regulator